MRGTFVRLKNKKVIGKIKEFSEFFFFHRKNQVMYQFIHVNILLYLYFL